MLTGTSSPKLATWRVAALLSATGILVAYARPAAACSCLSFSHRESFQNADQVFEGIVVAERQRGESYRGNQIVDIDVVRSWGGVETARVQVEVDRTSSCAIAPLVLHRRYLLYTYGWQLSGCDRWASYGTSDYDAQLAALGPGRAWLTPVRTAPTPLRLMEVHRQGCGGCAISGHRTDATAYAGWMVLGLWLVALRRWRRIGLAALVMFSTLGCAQQASYARPHRLAAGANHTCVVDEWRNVVCWGDNEQGQLGRDRPRRWQPRHGQLVRLIGTGPIDEVAAGEHHTCARSVDGRVLCWGGNAWGQTGRSPSEPFGGGAPIRVPGIDDAVRIAAGVAHTCALRSDGSVVCWGASDGWASGSDGRALSTPRTIDGLSDVIDISAAMAVTCATERSRRVFCWGDRFGTSGRPTEVVELRGFESVALSRYGGCGRHQDGVSRCWDWRPSRELLFVEIAGQRVWRCGRGDDSDDYPSLCLRAEDTPAAIAAAVGASHVCVMDRDGAVRCWGSNEHGQCGLSAESRVPAFIVDDLDGVAELQDGAARMMSGEVRWLDVTWQPPRRLDDQSFVSPIGRTPEVRVTDVPGIDDADQLRCDSTRCCVRRRNGQIECFGNRSQRPGLAHFVYRGADAIDIAVRRDAVCWVRRTGEVQCHDSRVTNASVVQRPVPPASEIEASHDCWCARTRGRRQYCWAPRFEIDDLPTEPSARCWIDMDGSGRSTGVDDRPACRLTLQGRIACVGVSSMELPDIRDAVELAGSCARLESGRVACWNREAVTQAIDGRVDTPTRVPHLRGFTGDSLARW